MSVQRHRIARPFASRRYGGLAACLLFAVTAAGCSVDVVALKPDLSKIKETVAPRDLNVFQRRQPMTGVPVAAEELVGADGRCAFDPAPDPSAALNFTAGPTARPGAPDPAAAGAPEAAAPQMTVRGIALGMTECEVVRVAGYTDRVEIGANERGQRSVVLTYMSGPRPGIYRFTGGRLASMERGPEPVPEKPARPARQRRSG